MAMTLGITIPSPPSTSSDGPRTPSSPTRPSSGGTSASSDSASKRKPSRRANTAERRATHNAVERARRETLNSRFLDLAKLLPNLSQIRRPSKSAIVNSSIAHIHASRRGRALASRELRMLKLESDHLRRELNEWRDRAGIQRVEEPVRGDGFSMVLNGELEVIPVVGCTEEDDEDEMEEGGAIGIEEQQKIMIQQQQQQQQQHHRASPPSLAVNTFHPRPQYNPHIASPTAMSFDNPALATYDNAPFPYVQLPQQPHDKFPINVSQQQNWASAVRGRGRSGSITSSSGSASPPHMSYPQHPHAQQQQAFEPGWGGLGMGVGMGSVGPGYGMM